MWIWDTPRGQITDAVIKKSAGLQRYPGAAYKGECDLFQAPKLSIDAEPTELPVCAGVCKGGKKCHLAAVGWEGRHSDVFDVNVFCTCMTAEELNKWATAKKGKVIDLDTASAKPAAKQTVKPAVKRPG